MLCEPLKLLVQQRDHIRYLVTGNCMLPECEWEEMVECDLVPVKCLEVVMRTGKEPYEKQSISYHPSPD